MPFSPDVEAWHEEQRQQWAASNSKLDAIATAQGGIMATLADVVAAEQALDDSVQAAAARVAADLAALRDQVAALQAQVDAGGGVTAADLQAVVDGLNNIGTEASAIDPAAEPTPPAEPPMDM